MQRRTLTFLVLASLCMFASAAQGGAVARAQDGGASLGGSASVDESASLNEPAPQDEGARDEGGAQNALESRMHTGLLLGGKVGAGLGKPWSDFGATPVFELELGYALPPLHRAIQLFFTGQYTQPGMSGTSSARDPRLPGDGLVHYDVTQQELTLSFGGLYRFDVGSRQVMPYGGLGGRLYLLDTKVKGSAGGQPYGQNEEKQTRVGLLLLGGVELFVGPGALLGELSFGWASIDSFVLRNTNLGALNLAVGYRLML